MKSEVKKNEDLEAELKLYKALYFRERKRLENVISELNKYKYLIPDSYRSIIEEIIRVEGIRFYE